jgi:acyl-lipid Delta6-acetylenase / acyl-lipid (9-3)-desaturase
MDGGHAVDPDIDTLPLLAWSSEMLSAVTDATHRALVSMQHYFFFPILLFSRFSWCQQSVSHSFDLTKVGGQLRWM